MLHKLRTLLRPKSAMPSASVPTGERIYALGDIHGRLDLFEIIAEAIEADDAARGAARTTVILLGDLVDRGPDSAGVIAAARIWQQHRRVRILTGNHEEMFLAASDRLPAFRVFLRFGGRETLLSYPIVAAAFQAAELPDAQAMMIEAVPREDLEFISTFEDCIQIGGYAFVHAGIEPGVPLAQQSPHELRWIREPFLSHQGDLGSVIIHGHTITDEAEVRRNRIGIDTGAYASGRLTAIGLEGTERWLIQTNSAGGNKCTITPV